MRRRERTTPGAAPGRPGARPQEGALDRPSGPLPTRVQDLAPLPAAFHDVLDRGLAALGVDVPPRARRIIDAHARFLLAWTGAINLTAIREPSAVARLHVLDSLVALPLLSELDVPAFLDLGSGGGYPGLPLAAALGGARVHLVDATAKKVRFLDTVIEATGLRDRVTAQAIRAETLGRDPSERERWPAVVARAVASLSELVEIGLPLVAPGGVLVAWKRLPLAAELEAAGPALDALRAGPVEVRDAGVPGLAGHVLVVVPGAGRIDRRFPRDPATRRRAPI